MYGRADRTCFVFLLRQSAQTYPHGTNQLHFNKISLYTFLKLISSLYKYIHSYCFSDTNIFICIVFSDTNIFGYSFVSSFYMNIFKRENSNLCAIKSKSEFLLFTSRVIYKENLLPFCCVNYVLTFCYHKSKI